MTSWPLEYGKLIRNYRKISNPEEIDTMVWHDIFESQQKLNNNWRFFPEGYVPIDLRLAVSPVSSLFAKPSLLAAEYLPTTNERSINPFF